MANGPLRKGDAQVASTARPVVSLDLLLSGFTEGSSLETAVGKPQTDDRPRTQLTQKVVWTQPASSRRCVGSDFISERR